MPAETDIDHIREAVLGGRNPVVPRAEAMRRLLEAKPQDAHTTFEAVLAKRSEDARFRALAVFYLGRLQTPPATAALIANIETIDQPTVLGALLRMVARIADASSLPVFDRLARKTTGPTARLARFAAALTAHRLNLPGHDVPMPTEDRLVAPAAGVPVSPIQIRLAGPSEIAAAVASLAKEPLGISISNAKAWRIQCGKFEWMMLVHEDFAGPQTLNRLTSRKAVPFVLAIHQAEEDDHRAALFILSQPSADKRTVNLLVHAADGRLSYAGTGIVEGGSVRFTIRTVSDASLAPLRIDGSFDGSSLTITSAIVAASVSTRQSEPLPERSAVRGRSN